MKATGIVRRLDELGRVVIPIELRRTLEMEDRQEIEIYVEDDVIILKKFEEACLFCDSKTDVMEVHGKSVCRKCIDEMKEI